MKKSVYIGVDIGGSNMRSALLTPSGNILRSAKTAVLIEHGANAVSDRLQQHCRSLLEFAESQGLKVESIGLGVAGKIDKASGSVLFSPNLPDLNGYPLGRELAEKTTIPVYMENDANVFCLGESQAGAARGMQNWVGIILGTGTGGCLFLDGRLWEGAGLGYSGEIGHMIVQPGGPACPCGSNGCLEAFASARALVSAAMRGISEKKLPADLTHRVAVKGKLDAQALYSIALEGNADVEELFKTMGWALGIALANLFTVLGIRHAVIGGGVSGSWDLFIGPLREALAQNLSMLDPALAVIHRSTLGDNAPLVGAGRVAETGRFGA